MSAPGAPAPMEGHGGYNRNSWIQAHALRSALDLWRTAAETVSEPPPGCPLTIADYGAAGGRNSLVPIGAAISSLRSRLGPRVPFSVVHVDVPGNDFTALFETLASDPESYLKADPLVFASAVGASFFAQVLPPESVSLGWSSWAIHWLSRAPCAIPDHINAELSGHAQVRAAFARQAASDWRGFLDARARELRPGGRLVVMTIAADAREQAFAPILAAIRDGLEDMVAAGEVSLAEVAAMVIPTAARDAEAYAAPFSGPDAVPGLHLLDLDIFDGLDPVFEAYEADKDAGAWAAQWVAFMRASGLPSLTVALEDRSPERVARFADALSARATTHLARVPGPMGTRFARLLIGKS